MPMVLNTDRHLATGVGKHGLLLAIHSLCLCDLVPRIAAEFEVVGDHRRGLVRIRERGLREFVHDLTRTALIRALSVPGALLGKRVGGNRCANSRMTASAASGLFVVMGLSSYIARRYFVHGVRYSAPRTFVLRPVVIV